MSIFTNPNSPVLPGQLNGTGNYNATYIDEFNGIVEEVIKRKCYGMKLAQPRTVKGAQVITKRSSGLSVIQTLGRGEAPDGTVHQFGKNSVTVDTPLITRELVWDLDEFQSDFNVREQLAKSQGEAHARKFDQTYFIQGLKAAKATTSKYGTDNFSGASQVTIAAGSKEDPAALMAAVSKLMTKMMEKDVIPQDDDVALYMPPAQYAALMNSDLVINGEFVTSSGTRLEGVPIFKAYGIPCFVTTNAPFGKNVVGHELSNAANSNAYDGDFTKDLILALSPKAVFAGQSIPLQSKVWYSDAHKSNIVDTWAAYGMTTDRVEYSGLISIE